jgi:hypothetical protein
MKQYVVSEIAKEVEKLIRNVHDVNDIMYINEVLRDQNRFMRSIATKVAKKFLEVGGKATFKDPRSNAIVECTVNKINRTRAKISIGNARYSIPLSMLTAK